MPHTKFQIVFAADDMVEIFIMIDGDLRKTTVDLSDAPFARTLMSEQIVSDAIKAWMLETSGPSWMSWRDVEAALLSASIDVGRLVTAHPAASVS